MCVCGGGGGGREEGRMGGSRREGGKQKLIIYFNKSVLSSKDKCMGCYHCKLYKDIYLCHRYMNVVLFSNLSLYLCIMF